MNVCVYTERETNMAKHEHYSIHVFIVLFFSVCLKFSKLEVGEKGSKQKISCKFQLKSFLWNTSQIILDWKGLSKFGFLGANSHPESKLSPD